MFRRLVATELHGVSAKWNIDAESVSIANRCARSIWNITMTGIRPGPMTMIFVISINNMRPEIAVGKYTSGNIVAFDSEGIVRAEAIDPTAARSSVPTTSVAIVSGISFRNEKPNITAIMGTKKI
jgi:hypothetical protein